MGFLTLILILSLSGALCDKEWEEDGVANLVVEAVVGRDILLPCDIEIPDDNIYMILWFRVTQGKPIYRVDVRGRPISTAISWSDPLAFGRRAHFANRTWPLNLQIQQIRDYEEGFYRCRVDFKNSPTQNSQIYLRIIVPPHQVIIYGEDKNNIPGVIGPMKVGDDFKVYCEVLGGLPQPKIKWLFDNVEINDEIIIQETGTLIKSTLQLRNAQRSWLHKIVRCSTTNTPLLIQERSTKIEMNLAPTVFEIMNFSREVVAGRETSATCVVYGSRPPAQIKWQENNRLPAKIVNLKESSNSTVMSSVMTIIPGSAQHNAVFQCIAEVPAIGYTREINFTLKVQYKPEVTLRLGEQISPNKIKEGDDIFFECIIKANPAVNRIIWFRNDKEIDPKKLNFILTSHHLTKRHIQLADQGLYICKAYNDIGVGASSSIYLRVRHVPVCATDVPRIVGAPLDVIVSIRCYVETDPPDVTFHWMFNNTSESMRISSARFVKLGTTASELRYSAASERDYGTLTCTARNSIGTQREPCMFHVVPASRPGPPENCTLLRLNWIDEPYMTVRCVGGYDGGHTIYVTLDAVEPRQEVYGKLKVHTLVNITAYRDEEIWMNVSIADMQVLGQNMPLYVRAGNIKGLSNPVPLPFIEYMWPTVKSPPEVAYHFPWFLMFVICTAVVAISSGVYIGYRVVRGHFSRPTAAEPRASTQCVVVDDNGRGVVYAYPAPQSGAIKLDILTRRRESAPRVVLETKDDNMYTIRDTDDDTNKSNSLTLTHSDETDSYSTTRTIRA